MTFSLSIYRTKQRSIDVKVGLTHRPGKRHFYFMANLLLVWVYFNAG